MSAPASDAVASLPEILRQPFAPAMTKEAAFEMRDSFQPALNGSMSAFLLLSIADREQMVASLLAVAEGDSVDEALNLIEAVNSVHDNFARALSIASMVRARVIVTAHEAFGVAWPDDAESTAETAEALA